MRELVWMVTGKAEFLGLTSGATSPDEVIPYDPAVFENPDLLLKHVRK